MYCCILKQNLVGLIFMVLYCTLKTEPWFTRVADEERHQCYMNVDPSGPPHPPPPAASVPPTSCLTTRNQNLSFLLPAYACVMVKVCNSFPIALHTVKMARVELTPAELK